MALVHLSYSEFKDIYGDLGLTYWAKYNWLSEENWYSLEVLPKDYEKVAYIESTGTQYIDSGVKGNFDTKVNIKIQCTSQTIIGSGYRLLGSRITANNGFFISTNNGYLYADFDSKGGSSNYLLNTTDVLELELSKDGLIKNGTKIISFNEPTSYETPNNLVIFGGDQSGSVVAKDWKIWLCKIYEADELVRYFVPCVRKADNEAGLYDLVNNEFYANAGSGDFVIPS